MNRLKHAFTTLIGTIIIVAVLFFIYKGKTTFVEASGFLTIGVALLFSDDEAFAKNFLPHLFNGKTPTETTNQTDQTNEH